MKKLSIALLSTMFVQSFSVMSEVNVVDNLDSGFTMHNNSQWATSAYNDGYWADNYRVLDATATSGYAEWVFTLSGTGQYEVFSRWVSSANRSADVIYTVHDDSGTTDVSVSQTQNGAMWFSLGEFSNPTKVVLSSNGTDGYVIADAAKAESVVSADVSTGGYRVVAYGQTTLSSNDSDSTQGICNIQANSSDSGGENYMYEFSYSDSLEQCECSSSKKVTISRFVSGDYTYIYNQCVVLD